MLGIRVLRLCGMYAAFRMGPGAELTASAGDPVASVSQEQADPGLQTGTSGPAEVCPRGALCGKVGFA